MDDIRARMGRLQAGAPSEDETRGRIAEKSFMSASRAACSFAPTPSLAPSRWPEWRLGQWRCSIPLRVTVVAAVLLVVLLSWGGMFVTLEEFTGSVGSKAISSCSSAISSQGRLITNLTRTNSRDICAGILSEMKIMVERYIQTPANDAVDAMWGHMRTVEKFGSLKDSMDSFEERRSLNYYAWQEICSQWSLTPDRTASPSGQVGNASNYPRLDWLHITWENEQTTGVMVRDTGYTGQVDAEVFESPGGTPGEPSNATFWLVDPESGDLVEPPAQRRNLTPTLRPFYTVQRWIYEAASRRPGGAGAVGATRAWSELYIFIDGNLGLSWTAPIAFCGNYSCFQGVVSADIRLKSISWDCQQHWLSLQQQTASEGTVIGTDNSTIFIVDMYSPRFPNQTGMLVGASHADLAMVGGNLTYAVSSPQAIVRSTAKSLIQRFHTWNDERLERPEPLWTSFRLSEAHRDEPLFAECLESPDDGLSMDGDCVKVGAMPLWLDYNRDTRWLMVVVLPAASFRQQGKQVVREVGANLDAFSHSWRRRARNAAVLGISLLVGIVAIGTTLSLCLSCVVMAPLQRLSDLMRRLADLDFTDESGELERLCDGEFSRIRDVAKLQQAFCSLSRGTEAFARFVPETVVRHIVQGDQRATRLHVEPREVTIMFSVIQDAAGLSEHLPQSDFLLMLTRYFSVMTRIVECFDGVVGEIMTEPPGLLVFWNTPLSVECHAAKACAAALAQQEAARELTEEFSRQGLPEIGIHIGIHTGPVLTGNIGSEMKMKFGCLGDPMNLASRLAGLCKVYGVGVICSCATHETLPDAMVCRRLDLVKVKGRHEPTKIYEVVGQGDEEWPDAMPQAGDDLELGRACGKCAMCGTGTSTTSRTSSAAAPRPLPSTAFAVTTSMRMSSEALTRKSASLFRPHLWSSVLRRAAGAPQGLHAHREASSRTRGSKESKESKGSRARAASSTPGPCRPLCQRHSGRVTEEMRTYVARYEDALAAYQQARFGDARRLAEALLEDHPGDLSAASLYRRAGLHVGTDGGVANLSDEELRAWTGVVNMVHK